MSKSGKRDTAKAIKPSHKAPTSGHTVVRRQALPPAPKPATGYTVRAKSGRYIITSPAKSANSISTWSRAFKDT